MPFGEQSSPTLDRARPAIGDAGKLRIIAVCDHAHVSGGLAQVAHSSARALGLRGHDVTYFTAVAPIDPALGAANVSVICLDQQDMLTDPSPLQAAARTIWNVRAQRALATLLERCDPSNTIVHLHGWSKVLSPSVLQAARLSGIATVQTLHDYVSICPNGALYDYVAEANCPLRPMSASCILTNCDARNYRHKLWRVARHAALLATSGSVGSSDAIYMSRRQREILLPILPKGVTLHHVPNPVLARDLGPARVGESDVYSFIGRLSREKGAVLMAEAAKAAGVATRFIGDGPGRPDVERTVPGAIFTGWLGNEDVTVELRRSRALVFPSLWYETFGLTVHEALANGVPVIVSDNTVSAELVEHGVNGLLFKSGDKTSLAAQMTALQDPVLAAKLGAAAYTRYWSNPPTLDAHAETLVATYRKIIGAYALA